MLVYSELLETVIDLGTIIAIEGPSAETRPAVYDGNEKGPTFYQEWSIKIKTLYKDINYNEIMKLPIPRVEYEMYSKVKNPPKLGRKQAEKILNDFKDVQDKHSRSAKQLFKVKYKPLLDVWAKLRNNNPVIPIINTGEENKTLENDS